MGHDWRNVTVPQLVHWTGVPIRHGSLDGKPGTTFSRWNKHDPRYDSAIADVMTIERWKSIKRYFKLNNNLLRKKVEWRDMIHVQSMTLFTSVSSTI